jgi:hypothetical protein
MNEHRHGVFLIMAQGMLDCMELSDLPAAIRSYMKTDGHDIDTGLSKSIDLLEQHTSRHLVSSTERRYYSDGPLAFRYSNLPNSATQASFMPKLTERCPTIHAVAGPRSAPPGLVRVLEGRRSRGRDEKKREKQIHHRGGYWKFSCEMNQHALHERRASPSRYILDSAGCAN